MLKIMLKNTLHGISILSATVTTFTPPPNTTQQGQDKTVRQTNKQTNKQTSDPIEVRKFNNNFNF